MATTFNWIYLGTSSSVLDPTEGNTLAEGRSIWVGSTFGSSIDPLYAHITSATMIDNGGTAGALDANNSSANDQFSTNIGSGTATYTFDNSIQYNATITYVDGTTATVTAVFLQSTTGQMFLAPEITANADNTAYEAKPIQSITFNSVAQTGANLTTDRNFAAWDDGYVEGTSGNDLINAAYVEPIANGSDKIDNGDGISSSATAWQDDRVRAGAGNDTVLSGLGDDFVDGGTEADSIDGGDGNDSLYGGTGVFADTILGGLGNDSIDGDAGNDSLLGGAGVDTILGGLGNDTIDGGTEADSIDGGDGNDSLYGGTGVFGDTILGGLGNDSIDGDAGNDSLNGGAGVDTVLGGLGDDTVDGGTEADSIDGGDGNDSLYGGTGVFADTILGGLGNDSIDGDAGNDSLLGGAGVDSIRGGVGDDYVDGGTEADSIDGGDGNDSLFGGTGAFADTILGGIGNDTIDGDAGNDSLLGGAGVDSIRGGVGDDYVDGGTEADSIDGGDGNDSLFGGNGGFGDTILGGAGSDTIDGGAGDDSLFGGDGSDSLIGGAGADTMTGGLNSDRFTGITAGDVVDGSEDPDNSDIDILDLYASGWTKATTNIIYSDPSHENGTVEFLNGLGQVIGTMTFTNIETVVPCFTPGTMVETDSGPRPVETLSIGDLVLTMDHGLQPIRWIGQRDLSPADLARQPKLRPVLIREGALGPGLPARDMRVSPQHRLLMTGAHAELISGEAEALAPAVYYIGRPGIVQDAAATGISYIHLMFDRHEIVQSDGLWSESFQPGAATMSTMDRAQRDEILSLFPDLPGGGAIAYPAARSTLKRHEVLQILAS